MDKIERIYSKPFININTVYYNWHVKSHNTGWDLGEKSIQFHASYFYLQWNYNSEQTLVYRLALRLFGETPFLGIQDLLMVCGSTFMLWLLKKWHTKYLLWWKTQLFDECLSLRCGQQRLWELLPASLISGKRGGGAGDTTWQREHCSAQR